MFLYFKITVIIAQIIISTLEWYLNLNGIFYGLFQRVSMIVRCVLIPEAKCWIRIFVTFILTDGSKLNGMRLCRLDIWPDEHFELPPDFGITVGTKKSPTKMIPDLW